MIYTMIYTIIYTIIYRDSLISPHLKHALSPHPLSPRPLNPTAPKNVTSRTSYALKRMGDLGPFSLAFGTYISCKKFSGD